MAKEFHWPHGKRICVSVSVMLETWSEGKAPPYGVQATAPKPGVVDLAGIAWGSYGGKIGVYRLMRIPLGLTQDSCRALGVFPSPLWGGVSGGGSCYFAGYVLEHTVDIRRIAPIAACGACPLRLRLVSLAARRPRTCHSVLTATPTPNPSPQGGGEQTEFAA